MFQAARQTPHGSSGNPPQTDSWGDVAVSRPRSDGTINAATTRNNAMNSV